MVVVVVPATVVRHGGRLVMIAVVPRGGSPPAAAVPAADLLAAVLAVSPRSRTRAPHQRSAHVLPARDGLPHDRQDSPIMLGSAEEPELRAEGLHDDEK